MVTLLLAWKYLKISTHCTAAEHICVTRGMRVVVLIYTKYNGTDIADLLCHVGCVETCAHSIEIPRARLSMTFGCVLIIPVKHVGDTQQTCDEKMFIEHFISIKKEKKAEVITA